MSEYNNRGAIYNGIYDKARESFLNGDVTESERLCRLLLTYTDLGGFHKAGCHCILGLGTDCYVEHAEQAVDLYENLFIVRPGSSYTGDKPPSAEELELQQALLLGARESLAKAREDESAIREDYEDQLKKFENYHGRGPTHKELVRAHFAHHSANAAEYLDKFAESHQRYLDTGRPQEFFDDNEEDAEMQMGMQEKGKMKMDVEIEQEEDDEDVDLSILDCGPVY